jgi:hypothetical protein
VVTDRTPSAPRKCSKCAGGPKTSVSPGGGSKGYPLLALKSSVSRQGRVQGRGTPTLSHRTHRHPSRTAGGCIGAQSSHSSHFALGCGVPQASAPTRTTTSSRSGATGSRTTVRSTIKPHYPSPPRHLATSGRHLLFIFHSSQATTYSHLNGTQHTEGYRHCVVHARRATRIPPVYTSVCSHARGCRLSRLAWLCRVLAAGEQCAGIWSGRSVLPRACCRGSMD